MLVPLLIIVTVAIAIGLWFARGILGRRRWRRRYEKATTSLQGDAMRLEQEFLEAAAATGKPRGLVWTKSSFHDTALLARDRATGCIYALVGITVAFEAVLGGEMEEVAAVSNLRCATALLEWQAGKWTTAGRVLFNLEPDEAAERYSQNLDPIRQVTLKPHP